MTLDQIQREPTVFLLPEGRGQPESQVHRDYRAMFDEELRSWYTDSTLWPKDLLFNVFKQFFMIQVASMVFDLDTEIVDREKR